MIFHQEITEDQEQNFIHQNCQYSPECGGCSIINLPLANYRHKKIENLLKILAKSGLIFGSNANLLPNLTPITFLPIFQAKISHFDQDNFLQKILINSCLSNNQSINFIWLNQNSRIRANFQVSGNKIGFFSTNG